MRRNASPTGVNPAKQPVNFDDYLGLKKRKKLFFGNCLKKIEKTEILGMGCTYVFQSRFSKYGGVVVFILSLKQLLRAEFEGRAITPG